MCAPELDFLDYRFPHFQTCPLLYHEVGRGLGGGDVDLIPKLSSCEVTTGRVRVGSA